MVTDKEILDWLITKCVNVREPLPYGSRNIFWASPTDDDGVREIPSDLREQVSAIIEATKG